MRGAIVGFGTIGIGHWSAYRQMPDMTIGAIVDPVPERRARATVICPGIPVYDAIATMLRDDTIEFVDICSPPHTHLAYVRDALDARRHVLCEKPMLLAVRDYEGLLMRAVRAGHILYPCHNYKFAPALKLLKSTVTSDDYGALVSGHMRTFRPGHALGVPEWNPHWRRDRRLSGGGVTSDHGTHSVYLACHLCNRIPRAVSCVTGNLSADGHQGTEDTSLMTLDFEGNFRVMIELSWAAAFRSTYYAVMGSMENAIVDNDLFVHTRKSGDIIRRSLASDFDDPSHSSWFVDMIADFRAAIETPQRQVGLLQEALMTSITIEHAYESAKTGGGTRELPYPSVDLL